MTSEPSIDQTCSGSDSVAANETPPPGGQNIAPKTPGGSATMPPKIAMQKNSSGGGLAKWKAAALKIRALPDPWAGHHLDDIPEEVVTRYMYNPRSVKWKTDKVVVKMQAESFAHGAMRECFRMKKLSKFSQHPDWRNASNYVAKRYMKEAGRQVYFQDVKLQMDAKLWGEEYNKHKPPKKVDFFQTYIIEFHQRESSPLYCVEHLIEGDYIKYNSNSGFVSDMNRLTPHAFSHFTFEKSKHKLIIVDIQGVGDLYTDPQMHTVDQKEYGEANLGTKGMALFFSSHICNPICTAMGLTQFDLSKEELERLQNRKWTLSSSTTRIHPSHSEPILMPSRRGRGMGGEAGGGREEGSETTMRDAFQLLSLTISSTRPPLKRTSGHLGYLPPESPLESPGLTMTLQHLASVSEDGVLEEEEEEEGGERKGEEMGDDDDAIEAELSVERGAEDSSQYMGPQEGSTYSSSVAQERTRLSEGEGEGGGGKGEDSSLRILGLIYMELALYHELGRFSPDQVPDLVSVQFHLEKAATCNLPSALYTLAHIYLQQPHDSFKDVSVEASPANQRAAMQYLLQAAENGHRAAMIEMARALETGTEREERDDATGPTTDTKNWLEAVKWYNRALETPSDTSDTNDTSCQAIEAANPDYIITARLAEMCRSGGHQLERNPNRAGELYSQAADVAMANMKGKLANRYYMLAEEAWAEVEEEGEEEGGEEGGEEEEEKGEAGI